MLQTFGNFIEVGDSQESLIIVFSPSSIPIQQRWRHNGLSADFMADYFTTFFSADDPISLNRQTEIRDAISYIANELLENAMKYGYASAKYPVKIGLYLEHNEMRFYVSNRINPDDIADFQNFIQKLLVEDPDELYMRQIEMDADNETTLTSHLGYLTMINDYKAQLAWRFERLQQAPEIMIVTTMAQLAI